MTPGRNDEGGNLSGAYALGAVSDTERAAHEAAARRSEQLRSETTELADTAVLLGLATPPVEPSPELKARLMAQIATTPQLPALVAVESVADEGAHESADAAETPATPGPAELKARSRWTRPIAAIASIAAAVAIVTGGIAIGTSSLHPEQSYQAAQFTRITDAPDVHELTTDLVGGQHVTVRWSPTLASSALIVDGMDPAPADSVYQLWYIDAAGARPAGFLPVSGEGESWQVLDGSMIPGDKIGVTVEPAGGSPAPTTDPVMVIEPA
jgi:anti-sigma-K factor RskA